MAAPTTRGLGVAKTYGAPVVDPVDDLIAAPDVDVVVVATPPASHGRPQRLLFENDASDEDLDDAHWFWDAQRSGGIFVEHGGHFFDAATMLLGHPATAVQATSATRAGTGLTDLVSATVRRGDDVLATHTHSFTHAHRCERQLIRLDHGAAETRVEGWIPVDAVVDLWTDDAGLATCEALPGRTAELLDVPGFRLGDDARVTVDAHRDTGTPAARRRGRDLHVPHQVRTGSTPRSGIATGAAATTLALAATRAVELQQSVNLSGDPS